MEEKQQNQNQKKECKNECCTIKVKRINYVKNSDLAKEPTRGSAAAAGYDLYAAIEKYINVGPHCTVPIDTGISMAIPDGYFGAIYARSGLASREGLRPSNCVGVVDSDYRGNIIVSIHNDSNEVRKIEPQERIAQIIIQPYLSVDFKEVKQLNETERGENGFGSTGKK